MKDKTLKCVACGSEFIFTEREQRFFASKGFYEPLHCPACRSKRREAKRKTRR